MNYYDFLGKIDLCLAVKSSNVILCKEPDINKFYIRADTTSTYKQTSKMVLNKMLRENKKWKVYG